jgi:hypothetical protein
VVSPPLASIPEVEEHGKGLAPSGLIVGLLQEEPGGAAPDFAQLRDGLLQERSRLQDRRTMTVVIRAATLMSIQCCNCGLYGHFRRECLRGREGCPGSGRNFTRINTSCWGTYWRYIAEGRNRTKYIVGEQLYCVSQKENHRIYVDYRSLNAVTKPDAYPIPNIVNTLDFWELVKYF